MDLDKIFNDVSIFSGTFTPKNQYISGEYDLTYLQNIKTKLENLDLYSTVKIIKDKMIYILKLMSMP